MIINKNFFFNIVLVIFFLIIPFSVEAAWTGLVPCGNTSDPADACTLCKFLLMFQKIMDWGLTVIIVVAVAMIFISGILYIVSSGNPEMMQKAKGVLTACIIGVAIVFLAWLTINTILWVLGATTSTGTWTDDTGSWIGAWYEIPCQ